MLAKRLGVLGALVILTAMAFMTLGSRGNWDFILPFRGTKLLALVVIATAVSTATLLFQTLSGNRILTPAIMGFDALYVLLQTILVFLLGGYGFAHLHPQTKFFAEIALMLVASFILFGTLLGRGRQDLHRLILTGVIFGVLFRSLTSFVQRIIDPNEFAIVQVASYARFNSVNADLLWLSTGIVIVACAWSWMLRSKLDVMELGRSTAINLGLPYDRLIIILLGIVAILVSVSTALVGPIVFFGLLVTSLTHQLIPTHRHAILLPAAALIACIILIGGQTLFERVLRLETTVTIVIEFVGGLVFLMLIFKGRKS